MLHLDIFVVLLLLDENNLISQMQQENKTKVKPSYKYCHHCEILFKVALNTHSPNHSPIHLGIFCYISLLNLPIFYVYLTFTAVKTHSPDKPVLVFVSSRRQTRLTALDLIAFLASEDNPKQWLHMEEMEVSQLWIFYFSNTY